MVLKRCVIVFVGLSAVGSCAYCLSITFCCVSSVLGAVFFREHVSSNFNKVLYLRIFCSFLRVFFNIWITKNYNVTATSNNMTYQHLILRLSKNLLQKFKILIQFIFYVYISKDKKYIYKAYHLQNILNYGLLSKKTKTANNYNNYATPHHQLSNSVYRIASNNILRFGNNRHTQY